MAAPSSSHQTVLHWGAYTAEVTDGRLTALRPFAADPDPSPIAQSIPAAIDGPGRVRRPMVREGIGCVAKLVGPRR